MIKVGNILIDPDNISSIHRDLSSPLAQREKEVLQIVYKNGVVKNFTVPEVGMCCADFIRAFIERSDKAETDRIFRIMAALKSVQNG